MGLLEQLGLKPSRLWLREQALAAARAKPTQAKDIVAGQATSVGVPLAPHKFDPADKPAAARRLDAEPLTSAEREAADRLLPALGVRRQQLSALSGRIEQARRKVDTLIASAPADKKPGLEAARGKLEAALAKTSTELTKVAADIDAIDDPHTTRAVLVKLLARGGSTASLDELTEIESTFGMKGDRLNERSQASRTTALSKGVATVQTEKTSVKLGTDGVTATKTEETERTWQQGSVKTGQETTAKLGPKGVSVKQTRTAEAGLSDGRTVSTEESSGLDVGPGGVKKTASYKVTHEDGSAQETQTDLGLTRGDGELGLAGGKSVASTDAQGRELSGGAKGSAGLSAKKGEIGGFGKAEAEVGTKRENGFSTGAVGGLHGNVSCEVGKPDGQPPLYPVTLKVSLGADITLKTGVAKKGAPGQGGLDVRLGAEVTMERTQNLPAEKLQAYVQALQAASKGTLAATDLEFQVIHAGVSQGWDVAQLLWKNKGSPLSADVLEWLKTEGDAVKLGQKTSAGGSLKGEFKAVSAELGAQQEHERSTTVTRAKGDRVDVDAESSETGKLSAKGGVSLGVVGGSAGVSSTVKTSFGYEITVDVKKDVDGRALTALQQLARDGTEPQYERFIAEFGHCVTLKGRRKGRAVADSESVGVSVAGVEASIGLDSGVARQTKTDAQGGLVEETVVGSAGAGGGVKLGGVVLGDSSADEAVARRNGDGEASLELQRTRKSTRLDKLARYAASRLPFGQEDEKAAAAGGGEDGQKPKGLLATAAGAQDEIDTEAVDRIGLKLGRDDLVRIGQLASDESRWTAAAARHQEYADWKAVGRRIRDAGGAPGVVATELAAFVGGDKIHRLDVLRRLIRPPGKVGLGKAFEFPESLKGQRQAYEQLIDTACEAQVRTLAAGGGDGPKKAAELGQQLLERVEALRQAWTQAGDFSAEGVRAEMLSAIARRKTALAEAIREAAGRDSAADREQAALEAFGRLNRECFGYRQRQDALFGKVRDQLDGRDRIMVANGDFAKAEVHMRALSDLYAIWKRDLDEAVQLAQAHGIPERRWQENQPDLKEWERLKRACMMNNL